LLCLREIFDKEGQSNFWDLEIKNRQLEKKHRKQEKKRHGKRAIEVSERNAADL